MTTNVTWILVVSKTNLPKESRKRTQNLLNKTHLLSQRIRFFYSKSSSLCRNSNIRYTCAQRFNVFCGCRMVTFQIFGEYSESIHNLREQKRFSRKSSIFLRNSHLLIQSNSAFHRELCSLAEAQWKPTKCVIPLGVSTCSHSTHSLIAHSSVTTLLSSWAVGVFVVRIQFHYLPIHLYL